LADASTWADRQKRELWRGGAIRRHPRRRSAMRGFAVAPIQYRGVALRHVGPRDAT
jgi:hypothetical protein